MGDQELLVLAAKAEGRDPPVDAHGVWSAWVGSMENGHWWNPLEDDGDALRLAVKLDIHIKRYEGATTCQELLSRKSFTEHDHWSANVNNPMQSTRRAIVCAAADIGKSLP